MAQWKRVTEKDHITYIEESDKCGYYMEYTIGGGWKASEANRLILNFKKDLKMMRNPYYEIEHRDDAITQFAKDLSKPISLILKKYSNSIINISFIPTSTSKKDPNYNDRFELVCQKLKDEFQNKISFHFPIEVIESRPNSSGRNQIRDRDYIKDLKKNFFWQEFPKEEPNILIIFDDVITSGSQFRAYKEFLIENINKKPSKIIGIFWAKAIHHNNEVGMEAIETEDIQS